MLRWRKENPEEFERTYHRRSLVESVFSSLKARFGAVVAAKTLPLQRLQLILRSICYNLLSWSNCNAPDACPSPSASCAAPPRSAPIPVPLQSECVKERPNRRNCGRHGTTKTASSRMVFAEMDNAGCTSRRRRRLQFRRLRRRQGDPEPACMIGPEARWRCLRFMTHGRCLAHAFLSSVRLGQTTTLATSGHNHQACDVWPVPDSRLLSSRCLSWAGLQSSYRARWPDYSQT